MKVLLLTTLFMVNNFVYAKNFSNLVIAEITKEYIDPIYQDDHLGHRPLFYEYFKVLNIHSFCGDEIQVGDRFKVLRGQLKILDPSCSPYGITRANCPVFTYKKFVVLQKGENQLKVSLANLSDLVSYECSTDFE